MGKPIMPLIQLKLMEQVFTLTKKKEIVSKLTDTVMPFEGEKCAPSHTGGRYEHH
jgi:phenylpyruvate tautomerase PptA (4-oxalocrotonate tautomerase family)